MLESKGIGALFQKKGKEMLKKGEIFENLGKNRQNLKISQVFQSICCMRVINHPYKEVFSKIAQAIYFPP